MAIDLDNVKPPKDREHINVYIPEKVKNSLKAFAQEEGLKEGELYTSIVMNAIATIDEIKTDFNRRTNELKAEIESLKTALEETEKREQKRDAEQSAQIDELTEIEAEQTKTIKSLTKAVETLSGQINELTDANDEKSRTIDHLTTKHVNLRLTREQMEALKAYIDYRAEYARAQEYDEFAETPEELVYVYLSNEIAARTLKPDEYDYKDLFPTLEAHLERLGLEKSNETPDDKATDETPDDTDNDDEITDDETDFEDEGPNDE